MKNLNTFIIERLKINKDTKAQSGYDFKIIYLPKMKTEVIYLNEEPKENKDDFIQLNCHDNNFTCVLQEKYVKVSDLKKYDRKYINKLFYEFGKELNSRVTIVDINYWDKEKKAWYTFASAESKLRHWSTFIIPYFARIKYPFT